MTARLELACADGFEAGPRALLWVLPAAGRPVRAVLVCVQPFAEEANLSRRVLVAQARRLAARGVAVLVPDAYGTGDSAGEFHDASLARWRDDIVRAAALAARRFGRAPLLWGVRFGALLAAHCAADAQAAALLVWHPVRDGGAPVAQYRRMARLRGLLRAPAAAPQEADPAAPAAARTGTSPGAAALAEPAGATAVIELGGYRLDAGLIEAMQALRWPQALPCPVLAPETGDAPAVPFWQAFDAPDDEALFAATERLLDEWLAEHGGPAGPDAPAEPVSKPPAPPAQPGPVEQAVSFGAPGRTLRGIVHAAAGPTGVVIVPGQPQTRVGSHRMFVQLARALAAAGYPALRYDLAGYGDSDGARTAYDAAPGDIAEAAAALRAAMPQLQQVVLWGLCDGATAAGLAAAGPARAAGLVLLNPWVHDESLRAQAMVEDHYRGRLASPAFWRRLATGGVRIGPALTEAAGHLLRALRGRGAQQGSPADRLRHALQRHRLPVCVLLSGQDMTAAETSTLLARDAAWQRLAERLRIERLPQADHTLSRAEDLRTASELTVGFLAAVASGSPPARPSSPSRPAPSAAAS